MKKVPLGLRWQSFDTVGIKAKNDPYSGYLMHYDELRTACILMDEVTKILVQHPELEQNQAKSLASMLEKARKQTKKEVTAHRKTKKRKKRTA